MFFVKAMTGSDNETSYTYIGYVFGNDPQTMRRGAKGRMEDPKTKIGQSVIYFNWLLRQLFGNSDNFNQIHFWHHGTCGRCGRRLTVPASIENGIGPECARRA